MVPLAEVRALPVRPRVALALAAAEQASCALETDAVVQDAVRDSLAAAWRWEASEDVTRIPARALYDAIHQLFRFEPQLAAKPRALAALFASIAALYYATHAADDAQWAVDRSGDRRRLPNDMADVDDEYVTGCLEYATEASADASRTAHYHARLLDWLAGQGADDPDSLGPIVDPASLPQA
jgi:hypothetical protein